jgi:hypothetical protein
MRIIGEGGHGLCGANTNSRDTSEASDGGRALRPIVELLLDTSDLADERLDLFEPEIAPQLLRSRRQSQSAEPGPTLLRPDSGLPRGRDVITAEQCARGILVTLLRENLGLQFCGQPTLSTGSETNPWNMRDWHRLRGVFSRSNAGIRESGGARQFGPKIDLGAHGRAVNRKRAHLKTPCTKSCPPDEDRIAIRTHPMNQVLARSQPPPELLGRPNRLASLITCKNKTGQGELLTQACGVSGRDCGPEGLI